MLSPAESNKTTTNYKKLEPIIAKKKTELANIPGININRLLQCMEGEGQGTTIHQIVGKNEKGETLNITTANIGNEKHITFMAKAPLTKKGITEPILERKTEEYKSKKVELGENTLIVPENEQTKEKATEILTEFLEIFKENLKEGVKILKSKENTKDTLKPIVTSNLYPTDPIVKNLFRPYTPFKGTVFGKSGTGTEYAKTYFSHFLEKKPIDVKLNKLKEFAFTKDGLVAVGDYTFTTEDNAEIKGSFFMLIGKDDRGLHFKTFHSAARDTVVN